MCKGDVASRSLWRLTPYSSQPLCNARLYSLTLNKKGPTKECLIFTFKVNPEITQPFKRINPDLLTKLDSVDVGLPRGI